MRRLFLQLTAAALAALSLLAPSAANAAQLFDVGPGGTDLNVATVAPLSKLPAWLQVVVSSANLYAADTTSNQVTAQLPRYTFLKVLGSGTSRLQVQSFDQNGNPAQYGWVSAEQVLPSAPGTSWMVVASATTLYPTPDATGTVRTLDQFTPLQQLDGPTDARVYVRVYSGDLRKTIDQGWVDVSATGAALPPQMRVPSPDGAGLRSYPSVSQAQFLNMAAQAALKGSASTGVPASVTVAQAILESDWGRSTLAQDANNYFGMKAMGTLGDAGVVWMPTSEYDASGQLYQTESAFRAYNSLAASVADHDELLQQAARYAPAMQVARDPKQFAQELEQDGYSTDPSYADKLIALMDRYNLYQLDS